MRDRPLGSTGLRVSEIGFGAWGIGGPTADVPAYGPTDDRESRLALERALELGVRFFDTADLYGDGHSERLLGEVLGTERDAVIATKVGFGNERLERDDVRRQLDASARRLRRDRVDVYQLHGPDLSCPTALVPVLDELRALREEGQIGAIGISLRAPHEAAAAIELGADCLQVNFNLTDQRALESGLFDRCERAGVGVIVRTPLCFGFLSGAVDAGTGFGDTDHRSRWSEKQRERWADAPRVFGATLAKAGEASAAQQALRFCLSYDAVSTVIPGMLRVEEVEENAAASALGPFPDALRRELEALYREREFFVEAG